MTISIKEIKDYLLKEQGYEESAVNSMSVYDLIDIYEMYHED